LNAAVELPATWPLRNVCSPRRLPFFCLVLVFVIYFGLTCYLQLLAVREPQKWFPPAAWLPNATAGMVNETLAYTLPVALILIVGFLVGVCRVPPREVGLDAAKLPAAVGLCVIIWVVIQVILVVVLALLGQEIALNREWTTGTWTWGVGQWIGQLCGNTFLEEVLFRGFLLPQCVLLMLRWMPTAGPRIQISAALVLSQGLFALPHVFFNSHQPEGQWLLLVQFVMGLTFSGIYIHTGNLFLAMGVHTLANNPSPLLMDSFQGTGLGGGITMLCAILAVAFVPFVVQWWRVGTRTAEQSHPPEPPIRSV
jgi:membrane protease YdiL (CAAX protease family)